MDVFGVVVMGHFLYAGTWVISCHLKLGDESGMKGIPTLKSFGRIEWKPNFWNDFLPTIS